MSISNFIRPAGRAAALTGSLLALLLVLPAYFPLLAQSAVPKKIKTVRIIDYQRTEEIVIQRELSNGSRGWELGERAGKNQFLNTIEYRYNFLEPRTVKIFGRSLYMAAQLAAFADLGCVWSERREFKPGSFLGGAGIGLRLIVPYVGLTRFDLAWGQPGMRVRLCLGSYEKPVRQRERVR